MEKSFFVKFTKKFYKDPYEFDSYPLTNFEKCMFIVYKLFFRNFFKE